jgi:hypothetical protein
MLYSLGKQIVEVVPNWKKLTPTQQAVAVTDMVGTGVMAGMIGSHGYTKATGIRAPITRGLETKKARLSKDLAFKLGQAEPTVVPRGPLPLSQAAVRAVEGKSEAPKPALPPEAKIVAPDIPPVRAEEFVEPEKVELPARPPGYTAPETRPQAERIAKLYQAEYADLFDLQKRIEEAEQFGDKAPDELIQERSDAIQRLDEFDRLHRQSSDVEATDSPEVAVGKVFRKNPGAGLGEAWFEATKMRQRAVEDARLDAEVEAKKEPTEEPQKEIYGIPKSVSQSAEAPVETRGQAPPEGGLQQRPAERAVPAETGQGSLPEFANSLVDQHAGLMAEYDKKSAKLIKLVDSNQDKPHDHAEVQYLMGKLETLEQVRASLKGLLDRHINSLKSAAPKPAPPKVETAGEGAGEVLGAEELNRQMAYSKELNRKGSEAKDANGFFSALLDLVNQKLSPNSESSKSLMGAIRRDIYNPESRSPNMQDVESVVHNKEWNDILIKLLGDDVIPLLSRGQQSLNANQAKATIRYLEDIGSQFEIGKIKPEQQVDKLTEEQILDEIDVRGLSTLKVRGNKEKATSEELRQRIINDRSADKKRWESAIDSERPESISAAVIDAYNIQIPPEYIRDGNRYVKKSKQPAPTPPVADPDLKPQAKAKELWEMTKDEYKRSR